MSNRSGQLRKQAHRAGRPRPSVVWMIYAREMMDQLRDRRTLFTIAVLPMLLYPLVGMLLLQVAQFTQQHPTSVCVVGTDHLVGDLPNLIDEARFADEWTDDQDRIKLVTYRWDEVPGQQETVDSSRSVAQITGRWVHDGVFDVVLLVPPAYASAVSPATDEDAKFQLLYNVASDQSMVARDRVRGVLSKWQRQWIRDRLRTTGVDLDTLSPFELSEIDIAPERTREAAFWSKLLPFIMLMWAMTGAFYPAIDLVAGEKERGTLETLLCSPALRSEIVWGKLCAVTTFSMMTAMLNAGSMLITSSLVFQQIASGSTPFGAPPIVPMLWLLVALIPLSSLFSALALAVAAMARSSKEGQYYLMPLMMVTLPLVLLPMLPGTTLSAATSLIPVTGMFLLVRSLVEGQFLQALVHLPIVAVVTVGCLSLAVTWAKRQFEDEAVLFGGGEQWELNQWVRHLWRDRQRAATPSQAFACGAIILISLFFGKLVVTEMPTTIQGVARLIMMPQIGMILAPTLMMATVLTTSLKDSLRIRLSSPMTLLAAAVLGVALHPTYVMIAGLVSYAYPISEQAAAAMKPFTDQISSAPLMTMIVLMAIIPSICEELAFRGFIFGGLIRNRGRLRAVLVSAIMFGVSHGVLQQSICATLMGLLIGWIAMKTASVLPGMLIHMANNTLSVSMGRIAQSDHPVANAILIDTPSGPHYQLVLVIISTTVAAGCLWYFWRLPAVEEDARVDLIAERNDYADPTAAMSPA